MLTCVGNFMQTVPTSMVRQALSESRDHPVDSVALRKYIALHETYEFAGKDNFLIKSSATA